MQFIKKEGVYFMNYNLEEVRLEMKVDNIINSLSNNTSIDTYRVLQDYLICKRLESCSGHTICTYSSILITFVKAMDKPLAEITTNDIRAYLEEYSAKHNIKKIGLENIRRCLYGFFKWCCEEKFIDDNPMTRIRKIKCPKVIKKPYSDEELARMKDVAIRTCCRDAAIINLLITSGLRVSEVSGLDIRDLDLDEKDGICYGKGAKERVFYYDSFTKIVIERYLSERLDDNPALFVSRMYPYKRLDRGGIEYIVNKIAEKANVSDAYPHRFRRTFATNMIYKGAPIEQVKEMLGHDKIDTTLIYAIVNQRDIKLNHRRYMQ